MHAFLRVLWGACLCRDHDDTEPESIKKAFCSRLGVRQFDIKVTRHRPEDFLMDFKFPHHRDAALAMEWLPIDNLDIHIKPWRRLPYGDHCELRHHVCLCKGSPPMLGMRASPMKTCFWHNNWLEGEAPKHLAPNLFRLVRMKNKTVQ